MKIFGKDNEALVKDVDKAFENKFNRSGLEKTVSINAGVSINFGTGGLFSITGGYCFGLGLPL